MSYVIDRRLNGKNKSTVNRQRFLRRYKSHIKKAVEDAVGRRSITDIEHGESISIPNRDIDEPIFHHGKGGRQTQVHPGNREFASGDRIARPEGGGGGQGGSQAGNSGEGMDEFVFQITQDEFLDFMFEDLALPNLVKRQLTGTDTFKPVRAGISQQGNPSRINIVRSMRAAQARRIALGGGSRKRLREARAELEQLRLDHPDDLGGIQRLQEEISALRNRIERAILLCDSDRIEPQHLQLPAILSSTGHSAIPLETPLNAAEASMQNDIEDMTDAFAEAFADLPAVPLEQLEMHYLNGLLESYNGDNAELAAALNISERTLYRKLAKAKQPRD